MASKGWGLFLVMIGLFGFVLLGGTLRSHNEAVVRVSPQGSTVIMSSSTLNATGDTSSALKSDHPLRLSPQPLPDLSGSPLFSLPPHDELQGEQTSSFKQSQRADGIHCNLYH